jgi:hypothetical protein
MSLPQDWPNDLPQALEWLPVNFVSENDVFLLKLTRFID